MSNWLSISLLALAFAAADVPKSTLLPAHPSNSNNLGSTLEGESIPTVPVMLAGDPGQGAADSKAPSSNSATLTETSKLALIRYVSGEFAKARKPIPAGKEGFVIYTDKPLNFDYLDRAVVKHGAAINTGDPTQITGLTFKDRTITVDINGGGRPKQHWWEHIQIGMGGATSPTADSSAPPPQDQGPPGIQSGAGGTLYIEFPKEIPNLTPADLKKILSPFLDFGGEHSAAVQWIDTLPPEMKKAITERHAVLGMDRDEVVAAMGKPDHKVRERDAEGYDTEDWIYGHPPDKTVFVHFRGEKVSSIKQYPD
ncbi:MAG TPA: hypothetical protein VL128_03500 [Candidatus Eisenbacteria bacterium]|nr:hypothetical protein [Candidatus Eisenbacteria bacterium]